MFNQVSRKRFNRRYKRKMVISIVSWILLLVAAIVIFILATRELARAEHPLEKYFKSDLPNGYQKRFPSRQISGPAWDMPKEVVYEGIVFTPTGYYHMYRPKRWDTLLAEWEKRGGNPNIKKRCFVDTKMQQIWYMEKAFDLIMDRILGRLFFTPFEEIMDVTSSYKKLRAEALLDRGKIRNDNKVEFQMDKVRRIK